MWTCFPNPLGCTGTVLLLGSHANFVVNILRNDQSVYQSGCVKPRIQRPEQSFQFCQILPMIVTHSFNLSYSIVVSSSFWFPIWFLSFPIILSFPVVENRSFLIQYILIKFPSLYFPKFLPTSPPPSWSLLSLIRKKIGF